MNTILGEDLRKDRVTYKVKSDEATQEERSYCLHFEVVLNQYREKLSRKEGFKAP